MHTVTELIPPTFVEMFGRLVRRTKTAPLERTTMRDYWLALREVPLIVLEQAAEDLSRTSVFFPSVAEWLARATRLQTGPNGRCVICRGHGVVVIRYHTGEPFDLAVCTCAKGDCFREENGVAFLRHRFHLGPANRVGGLENFDVEQP